MPRRRNTISRAGGTGESDKRWNPRAEGTVVTRTQEGRQKETCRKTGEPGRRMGQGRVRSAHGRATVPERCTVEAVFPPSARRKGWQTVARHGRTGPQWQELPVIFRRRAGCQGLGGRAGSLEEKDGTEENGLLKGRNRAGSEERVWVPVREMLFWSGKPENRWKDAAWLIR